MVIDASALVAIALDEAERLPFSLAIAADPVRLVSTGTLLESAMVLISRKGDVAADALQTFVRRMDISAEPFTEDQLALATAAFRRFGKGRHAAGLNFGDCMTYALAKATGERLLYKGDDFSKTDIGRVKPSPA
jgi:ribonuclease VapC